MRYLGVLFLVLAFTASAQAESSDWSAYIESGPSRPLVQTHPSKSELESRSKASAAKPQKRVARASKTKASKAKVKARAKKKSRRK